MDQIPVDRYPTIVAYPLQEYLTETNPVLRLWAACDTVEMTLRLLVMVGLTDIRRTAANLPEPLLNELRSRIEAPTLGMWRGMAEAVAKSLPKDTMVPEMTPWVTQIGELLDGDTDRPVSADTSFAALRNRLAHGGGVTKAAAAELLGKWDAKFLALVNGLAGLSTFTLVVQGEDGSPAELRGPSSVLQPYTPTDDRVRDAVLTALRNEKEVVFVRGDRAAPLWPLKLYGVPEHPDPNRVQSMTSVAQTYVRRGETFLQMTPIGSEIAESISDAAALDVFRTLFRLDEQDSAAGSKTASRFDAAIRKDAAQFVGRAAEMEQLRGQMSGMDGGVLWLFGTAGIGKSYVMARLAADWLDSHTSDDELTLAYRFKIGDAGCSQDAFLRFAVERLEALLGGDTRRDPDLLQRFRALLKECGPKRVWFLLDGMDEIIQRDSRFPEEVVFGLTALPGVVWLCAGRPIAELQKTFSPDRCRVVFGEGLRPMTDDDVRTLLLENIGNLRNVLLKWDREEEGRINNDFIARVAFHAQGLPLYVRYVINDIKGGQYRVLDIGEALPKSLDDYHAILLRRLGIGMLASYLTPLVATLAAAHEPLPVATLAELLARRDLVSEGASGVEEVFTGLAAAETMIRRALTPEGVEGYTIYHGSLRQHMAEKLDGGKAVRLSAQSLRRWCSEWPRHRAPYALRQLAGHLFSAGDWEGLFSLADNDDFLQAQATGLPTDLDAPLRTLRTAFQGAIDSSDAFQMAKHVLRHAELIDVLHQENPLAALNTSDPKTLTRAWALADLFPIQDAALWYLLISWKLKGSNNVSAARKTLNRLQDKQLLIIERPWIELAAFGLLHALSVDESVSSLLATRLLQSGNLFELCLCLITQKDLLDTALSFAKHILGAGHRSQALAAVAHALAEEGRTDEASDAFAQALAAAKAGDDGRSRSQGLAYVARALASAGRTDGAADAFAQALAAAKASLSGWSRSEALAAVARALAEEGRTDEALDAAQAIQDEGFRPSTLANIAHALAGAGRAEEATTIFARALAAAREVSIRALSDGWTPSQALADVACALAGAGRTDQALAAANTFVGNLVRTSYEGFPDNPYWSRARAYAAVARALADEGRTDEALGAARHIPSGGTRAEVLAYVARALAEEGRTDGAADAFAQALNTMRVPPDYSSRSKALAAVAHTLVEEGRIDETLGAAQAIPDEGDRSKALAEVACALASIGRTDEAADAFARSLNAARNIHDAGTCAEVLVAVVHTLVEAGRTDEALAAAHAIPSRPEISGSLATVAHALSEVACALAEEGRSDEATAAFAKALTKALAIPDEGNRSRVKTALARALAGAGRTDEALDAARHIPSGGTRAEVLAYVARALAGKGRTDEAADAFARALAVAQAIPDEGNRSKALADIAQVLASTGRTDEAATTFAQALTAAQAASSKLDQTEALQLLAEYPLSETLTNILADLTDGIQSERQKALSRVINSFAQSGNRVGVLLLLSSCAFFMASAYAACGALATLYPDRAAEIAQLLVGKDLG